MSSKNVDQQQVASSKAMRHTWSITRRLAVLSTLAGCAILLSCSVLLYWGLVSNLRGQTRKNYLDEIDTLRAVLSLDHGEQLLAEKIVVEYPVRKYMQRYVRLLHENGDVVMESPRMDDVAPQGKFIFPPQNGEDFDRQRLVTPDGRVLILRTLFVDSKADQQQRHVLQLAFDVTTEWEIIRNYRARLILVLCIGILISAVGGFYITRRQLRPLYQIAEKTGNITADSLSERISSPSLPKELAIVADAFDRMMGNIQDSFERLSHCASNMAHELRTPIHNMIGAAQVTLARGRTAEEYRKHIESNIEEYERLGQIIDSLIFLARASNGLIQPHLVEFRAMEVIDEVLAFYAPLCEDQNITISCQGSALLRADRDLFRGVIANLLSNAIKFSPVGSQVTINTAQLADQTVEITVKDSGRGIAAEHLPHLFERFYRVPGPDGQAAAGFGLGLSICKSVMDIHGGLIRIESSVGKGTSAIISFPSPVAGTFHPSP